MFDVKGIVRIEVEPSIRIVTAGGEGVKKRPLKASSTAICTKCMHHVNHDENSHYQDNEIEESHDSSHNHISKNKFRVSNINQSKFVKSGSGASLSKKKKELTVSQSENDNSLVSPKEAIQRASHNRFNIVSDKSGKKNYVEIAEHKTRGYQNGSPDPAELIKKSPDAINQNSRTVEDTLNLETVDIIKIRNQSDPFNLMNSPVKDGNQNPISPVNIDNDRDNSSPELDLNFPKNVNNLERKEGEKIKIKVNPANDRQSKKALFEIEEGSLDIKTKQSERKIDNLTLEILPNTESAPSPIEKRVAGKMKLVSPTFGDPIPGLDPELNMTHYADILSER